MPRARLSRALALGAGGPRSMCECYSALPRSVHSGTPPIVSIESELHPYSSWTIVGLTFYHTPLKCCGRCPTFNLTLGRTFFKKHIGAGLHTLGWHTGSGVHPIQCDYNKASASREDVRYSWQSKSSVRMRQRPLENTWYDMKSRVIHSTR